MMEDGKWMMEKGKGKKEKGKGKREREDSLIFRVQKDRKRGRNEFNPDCEFQEVQLK